MADKPKKSCGEREKLWDLVSVRFKDTQAKLDACQEILKSPIQNPMMFEKGTHIQFWEDYDRVREELETSLEDLDRLGKEVKKYIRKREEPVKFD